MCLESVRFRQFDPKTTSFSPINLNEINDINTIETTTEIDEISLWRLNLQLEITNRDNLEIQPFIEITSSYEIILEENLSLNLRVTELSQALLKLKSEYGSFCA